MHPSTPAADDRRGSTATDVQLLGAACWIPLLAFLALMGFAAIACVRVGHWPHYANPDPKNLRLPVLHAAALLSYPIALVSIPACFLLLVATWGRLRRRDVVVFTAGTALWAFFLPITGRLFEWLID
jgi:hypothetical protein